VPTIRRNTAIAITAITTAASLAGCELAKPEAATPETVTITATPEDTAPAAPVAPEASSEPSNTPLPLNAADDAERPSPLTDPELAKRAEEFAQDMTRYLFEWDTTKITRDRVIELLLIFADPTGVETNGLVQDFETYLPSEADWETLTNYSTRQWLAVDRIDMPPSWPHLVADTGEDMLPGTIAYTVEGVRNRVGTFDGEEIAYRTPVLFTMFLTCQPTFDSCHLMRLSRLGNTLE